MLLQPVAVLGLLLRRSCAEIVELELLRRPAELEGPHWNRLAEGPLLGGSAGLRDGGEAHATAMSLLAQGLLQRHRFLVEGGVSLRQVGT